MGTCTKGGAASTAQAPHLAWRTGSLRGRTVVEKYSQRVLLLWSTLQGQRPPGLFPCCQFSRQDPVFIFENALALSHTIPALKLDRWKRKTRGISSGSVGPGMNLTLLRQPPPHPKAVGPQEPADAASVAGKWQGVGQRGSGAGEAFPPGSSSTRALKGGDRSRKPTEKADSGREASYLLNSL